MPLPIMTPEQRDAARVKAGQVRTARRDLKLRLKNGDATLAEVLEDGLTSDVTGKMRVSEVIGALPGMGKAKTAQLMERLNIAGNRRVRGLGPGQRAALLGELA